jgi:hypothetical protein
VAEAELVVELVTDAPAGFVVVFVTVSVLAGAVCVLVAPEIAFVASFAAPDTAELACPDPHPLRPAVAIPSASATITSGRRISRACAIAALIFGVAR